MLMVSVIMLNVTIKSIMLSDVMLSVTMLSVVAPCKLPHFRLPLPGKHVVGNTVQLITRHTVSYKITIVSYDCKNVYRIDAKSVQDGVSIQKEEMSFGFWVKLLFCNFQGPVL